MNGDIFWPVLVSTVVAFVLVSRWRWILAAIIVLLAIPVTSASIVGQLAVWAIWKTCLGLAWITRPLHRPAVWVFKMLAGLD